MRLSNIDMQLSNKHILQFQSLYKECFGKEISDKQALEQGTQLLRLIQIIYKPMTKLEYSHIKQEIIDIRQELTELNKNGKV